MTGTVKFNLTAYLRPPAQRPLDGADPADEPSQSIPSNATEGEET
jgi:hypothetical protein